MKRKHTVEISSTELKSLLKEKLSIGARVDDIKLSVDHQAYGDHTYITLSWEEEDEPKDYWSR